MTSTTTLRQRFWMNAERNLCVMWMCFPAALVRQLGAEMVAG